MNLLRRQTLAALLAEVSRSIDRRDAEILLATTLHVPREYLFSHDDEALSKSCEVRFRHLCAKRKCGVPLAYLTGHKGFFGLDFFVNRHVLIPRPETELLVELAIERIKNYQSKIKNILLIDVGTGSGCIPIAILKSLNQKNIKSFATDNSRTALGIARKNAIRHSVDITFLHGNLLYPIPLTLKSLSPVLITANLPYLTKEQFVREPSIQYEPHHALVADDLDGTSLYEKLLEQLQSLVSSFQFPVSLFFEIDPSQSQKMTSLIKRYLPKTTIEIKKDLCGRDRVISVEDGSIPTSHSHLAAPPQSKFFLDE